ncbi:hypothetical protein JEP44_09160 [Proteus mirabilis]|uniref:hypothetical protein n=1 Tax=Proteus mirabilis TaxID=584 RepID=UPI0013D255B4|nr:hypothetical protein [Proteus mirabilis]MBI6331718.1 hypothetical protein [Proteus mirabilis]HEJ9402989.1 hypothetical protein [Proteus mirabilis]
MKFKVSDRVRSIDYGYEGKIKNIDSNKKNPYQVEIIESDWIFTFWFAEEDLELINETSSSNDDTSVN